MQKIIFYLSFILIMSLSSSTAISGNVQLKKIDEVLLYCNKKEFIKNMVVKSYKMQLAASGLVHDEKHKHLASTEMWINTQTSQWAIVFVYKKQDKSCILGGNDIDLHTP
tara:strand:- start:628 stop:957 length:330 start_codon:yes stop_codon:yes gene_type:complete